MRLYQIHLLIELIVICLLRKLGTSSQYQVLLSILEDLERSASNLFPKILNLLLIYSTLVSFVVVLC